MSIKRVLVVDDDVDLAETMAAVLQQIGLESVQLSDPRAALALIDQQRGALRGVLSDLQMPGVSGLEVLAAAAKAGLPSVLMSGSREMTEEIAIRNGAAAYLPKSTELAVMKEVFVRIFGKERP